MVMTFCVAIALLTACAKKAAEPAAEVSPPAQAVPGAPAETVHPPEGVPVEGAAAPAPARTTDFGKKIYFAFDRFDLSEESVAVLGELAAHLKANQSSTVTIEGHCDERGTNEYNLALGERRAKAAFDYLVSLGIDPSRLSTVSYGEERPADPGHDEEAWAKNRRDEFMLGK